MFSMISVLHLFSILAKIFAAEPVEVSQYYKIYLLSEVNPRNATTAAYKIDNERSIIEFPFNGTIPPDYGDNYGDITFPTSMVSKNGTLVARDTIINNYAAGNRLIVYERKLNGVYVEDFQLLNFGRRRGYASVAEIFHSSGYVYAEILVPADKYVRVFAEIYART